ncbi:MAG: hypothetical protein EBE86_001950 [Hormoscilla sp. GUM202]|nr:hypothetical protein [Hormoscilla sp. GUM202]
MALVQPDAIQTPAFPLDLFEAIAAPRSHGSAWERDAPVESPDETQLTHCPSWW